MVLLQPQICPNILLVCEPARHFLHALHLKAQTAVKKVTAGIVTMSEGQFNFTRMEPFLSKTLRHISFWSSWFLQDLKQGY